jgi:hypothetical protein
VRAFRDADGQVNLILSHYEAYAMRGPDFDSLSCRLHADDDVEPG